MDALNNSKIWICILNPSKWTLNIEALKLVARHGFQQILDQKVSG